MAALQDDFRYAELPNGKLLKFPKSATDKEIQRAVRRELGLTNDDLMSSMDGFLVKVSELIDVTKDQHKRHVEAVDQYADAMQANAHRIAGEISDAIRSMNDGVDKFKTDLHKTMANQANLVIKLDDAINALNRTLDSALGQSLAAMDEGHGVTSRSAASMESSVNRLAMLVDGMSKTINEMSNMKRMKRRAVRERDGSWTMETG